MKIDPQAELLGRALVAAFVSKDVDRAEKAVEAISEAPVPTAEQVTTLYALVAKTSLIAIYQGYLPDEEQNRSFARKVVASETWSTIGEESVFEVLQSLAYNTELTMPPHEALLTLFLTVGYILALYCVPLGYKTFYEFLDECLEQIEKL